MAIPYGSPHPNRIVPDKRLSGTGSGRGSYIEVTGSLGIENSVDQGARSNSGKLSIRSDFRAALTNTFPDILTNSPSYFQSAIGDAPGC